MAEIIKNLSLAEYHDPSNGWVSHSRLHDFIERGPAYFHGRYITGEIAREETPSLVLGQALEDLFQRGGDYFAEHYALQPAHLNLATKAGIAWKAAQGGKPIIKADDYEMLLRCVASLRSCDKGMALCHGAEEQVTLRGEVFGLRMQARPDCLHLSDFGCYSVDVKTTKDMNDFWRSGRAPITYGYPTQAALVRKLLAVNGYEQASTYLFVVEKQGGFRRACFEVPDDYLAWADKLLEKECAELKKCLDSDTWPQGPDEIVPLVKPGWARIEQQEAAP